MLNSSGEAHWQWFAISRPTSSPLLPLLLQHALTSEAWRCDKRSLECLSPWNSAINTSSVCAARVVTRSAAASKANYSSAVSPQEFSTTSAPIPRKVGPMRSTHERLPSRISHVVNVWRFPWLAHRVQSNPTYASNADDSYQQETARRWTSAWSTQSAVVYRPNDRACWTAGP